MVLWDVLQQTAIKKNLKEQQWGQRVDNLLGMQATLSFQV